MNALRCGLYVIADLHKCFKLSVIIVKTLNHSSTLFSGCSVFPKYVIPL
jgi:hypothetical protein